MAALFLRAAYPPAARTSLIQIMVAESGRPKLNGAGMPTLNL